MTERDIRDHINAFLRTKLQTLLVPASMGLGLALGGCDSSSLHSNPDGSGNTAPLHPGSGGAGGAGGTAGTTGTGGIPYGTGGGSGGSSSGGSGGTSSGGAGGSWGVVYGFPLSGGAGGDRWTDGSRRSDLRNRRIHAWRCGRIGLGGGVVFRHPVAPEEQRGRLASGDGGPARMRRIVATRVIPGGM
jgi:hypothetical protein